MRYEDMEFENLRNIYSCISESPGLSRAGVAKHLSLSRTAASLLVSDLIASRLVSEAPGTAESGRGRPGFPLSVDDSFWRAAGAAMDSGKWKFAVCDLSGNIVDASEMEADVSSPESMQDALIKGIRKVQSKFGDTLIPGIGVGVPGIADATHGDILFAFDQGWFDSFNISQRINDETGLKAYVMNRYILEGVAEFTYANPDRIQDMIYIGVGSGIRSAIFSNGKLMYGSHFSAGRISHIQVNPHGRRCSCGRCGCLITEANSAALIEYVEQLLAECDDDSVLRRKALSAPVITKAADEGDRIASEAVRRVASALSKVICMVSDVVDPRKVVIGGPVGMSDSLVSFINSSLDEYFANSTLPFGRFHVSKATITDFSSAHGGASLVLRDVISLMLPSIKACKSRMN